MPITTNLTTVQCRDFPNCQICNDQYVAPGATPLTPEQRREFQRRVRAQETAARRRIAAEMRRNQDTVDEVVGKPTHGKGCFEDGRVCEACKIGTFEGSAIAGAIVQQYSAKPDKYKYNKVRNDPFTYFMGVELETDNNNSYTVSNEMGAGMARPVGFWLPKHDGSVSGPEFASHPATLTWWKKNREALEEMFTMLLHAGFSSHNGNHCGMHVNISRNAFETAGHLYRFLTLIHGNPRWSIAMSQRTEKSAQQWARLGAEKGWTKERIKRQAATDEETDHTTAVNFPPPDHQRGDRYDLYNGSLTPGQIDRSKLRYEFRLPRGTLRIDRFYKNLEWTVAMIEFTRTAKTKEVNSAQFTKFVLNNDTEYPFLADFMRERFKGSKKVAV